MQRPTATQSTVPLHWLDSRAPVVPPLLLRLHDPDEIPIRVTRSRPEADLLADKFGDAALHPGRSARSVLVSDERRVIAHWEDALDSANRIALPVVRCWTREPCQPEAFAAACLVEIGVVVCLLAIGKRDSHAATGPSVDGHGSDKENWQHQTERESNCHPTQG